eukprot:COSAG06_NODE_7224_length_2581_cov_1.892425_6_plen_51_part_01
MSIHVRILRGSEMDGPLAVLVLQLQLLRSAHLSTRYRSTSTLGFCQAAKCT